LSYNTFIICISVVINNNLLIILNMMDANAYNLAGTTNVLPAVQGDTQVLPAISPGGFQDTTGFGGLADSAGYFGGSATTNDIFGQTINTDTSEFGGVQTLGTTIDTNTYYGDTNFTQGITTDTNALYGATPGATDLNALYGTTQGITAINPDGNVGYGTTGAFGATTQTTTTTQTTYDTTGITTAGIPTGIQEYGVTPTTNYDLGAAYGTPIEQTATTQTTYTTTAVPTATAVDLAVPTTVGVPVATPLPPPATVTTVTQPVATVTPTVTTVTPPIATATPPVATVTQPVATVNPLLLGKPPVRNAIQYVTSPDGQVITTQYGQKIFDEDFRRGRPYYNFERNRGLLLPNNANLRPGYNVGLVNNHLVYDYPNTVRRNNLDRLGRGGSYDVYGRGITPLLNKAGLGTVDTTSKIKDFL
jgi:hypothetical protein